MSKKKTEEQEPSLDIKEAFKVLDDLNPDAQFLDENTLSTVKDWIDTGSMALNAIISGSLYGGVPMGRIVGFAGPQACGKTLMVNKIMANAQKKGLHVVYFDTENALDKETAEGLGCDSAKIKHCPIEIIEECRNQIARKGYYCNRFFRKFDLCKRSKGNRRRKRLCGYGSKSSFFEKHVESDYTCSCKSKLSCDFH